MKKQKYAPTDLSMQNDLQANENEKPDFITVKDSTFCLRFDSKKNKVKVYDDESGDYLFEDYLFELNNSEKSVIKEIVTIFKKGYDKGYNTGVFHGKKKLREDLKDLLEI